MFKNIYYWSLPSKIKSIFNFTEFALCDWINKSKFCLGDTTLMKIHESNI